MILPFSQIYPFFRLDRLLGRRAPAVSPAGPQDAPQLAVLHAAAFRRGWSAEEFERLLIERNVLEWRFDPASSARLPIARYDLQVVVVCSEGYTSSLAAAALLDLGLSRATDLDGGFRAWQAAGLPVTYSAAAPRRGQSSGS